MHRERNSLGEACWNYQNSRKVRELCYQRKDGIVNKTFVQTLEALILDGVSLKMENFEEFHRKCKGKLMANSVNYWAKNGGIL